MGMMQSDNAWTRASLWLVAAALAAFLIGLGGKLLDRMWDAGVPLALTQFLDPAATARAQTAIRQADSAGQAARLRLEQTQHQLGVAKNNSALARQNFHVWLASRAAAARPDQDAELATRSGELDQVLAAEQQALSAVHDAEQALALAGRQRDDATRDWGLHEQRAMAQLEQARWRQQLHMFLFRLAVTAPLILLACWLFIKKRDSAYWPFIWGYISFAAFMFFVELIPYVPSYGGYVRYIVGIVVTVLVGRFAIMSLQPGEPARAAASAARLFDGQCPGCAIALDLRTAAQACGHCGLQLFNQCPECKTRKVAFARFCLACGTPDVPRQT